MIEFVMAGMSPLKSDLGSWPLTAAVPRKGEIVFIQGSGREEDEKYANRWWEVEQVRWMFRRTVDGASAQTAIVSLLYISDMKDDEEADEGEDEEGVKSANDTFSKILDKADPKSTS